MPCRSLYQASWRRWAFRGALKGRKEERQLGAAKEGPENVDQAKVFRGCPKGVSVRAVSRDLTPTSQKTRER